MGWSALFHAQDAEFILNSSQIFQTRGKRKNMWSPWQVFSHCASIFIPVYGAEVPNLRPTGCMQPRMAVDMAQHKIVSFLKTLWDYFVNTCCNVVNVWPKTTLLLPVWPKDSKRWGAPGSSGSTKTSVLRLTLCRTTLRDSLGGLLKCNKFKGNRMTISMDATGGKMYQVGSQILWTD